MKLGRLALAAFAATVGFGANALAANGSNFLHLTNGIDFFFGGFVNPQFPVGTNGAWRCFPADQLFAPTMVVGTTTVPAGQYATKIQSLHWGTLTSTGKTAVWPTVSLTSSDGDCRFVSGSALNYGFASAVAFGGGPGSGFFAVGPLNSPTTPGVANLLALILNVQFVNPFPLGTAVGLQLDLDPLFAAPSTIAVPEGESLVYWMADDPADAPGAYQYLIGSNDERNICSSLSYFASAIGTAAGSAFAFTPVLEWGMFLGTLDATLAAAVAPSIAPTGGAETHQAGFANPIDVGTGGRTISLTGTTPEGGNGLGFEVLSLISYDEFNAFGGSNRLVFANLMSVNLNGTGSCGPWTPGYFAVATGGPGGPVLTTSIPQNPRIVGKFDAVTAALLANPIWLAATMHANVPGGAHYPMFGAFPTVGTSGSTGNNGGFGIPVPNLPALIGVELFLSSVSLNGAGTAIAAAANNGHSNSNGFPVKFHP